MKVVTNETNPSKPIMIFLKVLLITFILYIIVGLFFWWNFFGGKLDNHISNEDLQEINSNLYTNLEDSSNIIEYFHQCMMQAGTCYSVYIKDIGSYQDFLTDYFTLSNTKIFTDSNTIKNELYYLNQYFKFTKDKNCNLDTFSPHTLVKSSTSNNDYNDIRLYFFTEDDNSQSVIINVIHDG